MVRKLRLGTLLSVLLLSALATGVRAETDMAKADASSPVPTPRIACWISDGTGMHPTGEFEGFLVDRLGASGERIATDPQTGHAVLRILGFSTMSVFDPAAAQRFAEAAQVEWVLWIKTVSRDVRSQKVLSFPYLINRRRLDANIFYDVRLYDATNRSIRGSKRLALSDRGETTWQFGEDEKLDPTYNNDPVELHQRMRGLDWRAAAAISRYVAEIFDGESVADATP